MYSHIEIPLKERILATSPAKKSVSKKASVSEDAARANRERPSEPKPYKATKEELLKFYRDMVLIRRFEEKAGQLYGLGLIGGFCHFVHRPRSRRHWTPIRADAGQRQRHHGLS